MSWAVGYDDAWERDIGYGVPATCDHPGCGAKIHRGLAYVCGGEPWGGDQGCGLYFCSSHLLMDGQGPQRCDRCIDGEVPHEPTPDHPDWVEHKLTDPTWGEWRDAHPEAVATMASKARPTTTQGE